MSFFPMKRVEYIGETIRQRLPEYVHEVERIVSVMHENLNDAVNR